MSQNETHDEHPSLFGVDQKQLDELLALGLNDDEQEQEPLWPMAFADGSVDKPGTCIGRYKLIRILGEGGMGIVHLAEQEHPIKRQVALKVIKPGMDTKQVIAHFEAERQVLAYFDHPNIAHVHDAGMTHRGRPFFVMEYVEGTPITDYCDQQRLSVEARLRLFLPVCEAVHHAHQKGIIHRDIKPSNILVSNQESRPLPRIIDFGVAKAIGKSLTEYSLHTEASQLLGTPEYMSPEQADMANEDIDIRSDVYSLGVLLYVLLVGRLPFDTQTLRGHGIEHLRRVIREQDPQTPASRLSELGKAEEAMEIARNRQTDIRSLHRSLHSELEWIPLMALRKERDRRYQSAADLAQDIRKYLSGDPLMAGPPGSRYRVSKFVRRNKTLVLASAALLIILVSGTVVSTLFAIHAGQQARNAATLYTFFNENLLDSLNPLKNNVDEVTATWILNRASDNLKNQFNDEPLVEASIRQTLASAYRELGALDPAQMHQDRALALRRENLGDTHADTLESMYTTVVLYREQSRYDEAVQLGRKTLTTQQRVLGPDHASTLLSMNIQGQVYQDQGNLTAAEQILDEAAQIAHRVLGEEHRYTLLIKVSLAGLYRAQGLFAKAESLLESIVPLYNRQWGEEHPYTLDLMRVLGMLYSRHKNPEDAEPIFLKELEIRRRVLGEEHLQTLSSVRSLAKLYIQQGRYLEAEALVLKAVTMGRRKYGEYHPTTLWNKTRLAALRTAQQRYQEAEPLLLQVIEGWSRIPGEKHPNILNGKYRLAGVYIGQGRILEAEPLLAEAYAGQSQKLGAEHPNTLDTANELGVCYTRQSRFAEAQPLLSLAWEGRRRKFGEDHPDTLTSLDNLVGLYESWEKPAEAAQWRAKRPSERKLP